MPEVVVSDDLKTATQLLAEFILRLVAKSSGPQFHLALSGGKSAEMIHKQLAQEPSISLPWQRTHLWWSDERAVSPEHSASNYRQAKEALIDQAPVPEENVHRIRGELGAKQAAQQYEEEIQSLLDADPVFDLVMLGLGSDGHVASIFSAEMETVSQHRLVATTNGGDPHLDRVTLTLAAINSARDVVVFTSGSEKADVVERVLMGDMSLPAAHVAPVAGEEHLHFFLDRAAAKNFEKDP